MPLPPPSDLPDWVGLSDEELPVGAGLAWATLGSCGAVVTFTGTTRDHSDGRPGVTRLRYEAYEEQAVPRLERLAAALRRRWPELGRVVLWHRVGDVAVGEVSVVVVVSAPHRPEAFAAARAGIDTLKATLPVWKQEFWDGGEGPALECHHAGEPEDLLEGVA